MTLLEIDIVSLILDGFYIGVLVSGSIGIFMVGVKYALKFFNKL